MTRFKKLVSAVLLFAFSFSFFASTFSPVLALETGTWYKQDFEQWHEKVYDTSNPQEIFGERYTAAQVQWIFYSLVSLLLPDAVASCSGANISVVDCLKEVKQFLEDNDLIPLGQPNTYLATNGEPKSLVSSFVDASSGSGISAIGYTKSLISKIGVPEARAQGFGFQQLELSLVLWRMSRNVAFALIILIIIIMAFMIMFRTKIAPQVVITVQSALPKIIITLILITFSYAIAGLLFDVMNIAFGLLSLIISNSGVVATDATPAQIFGVFLDNTALGMIALVTVFYVAVTIVLGVGSLFLGPLALFGILATILFAVIAVLLIVTAVRTFWLLLRAYVNILLLVIAGPFQILFGAISAEGGIGRWIRSLLGNFIVFPTTGFMLFLAHLFFWGGALGGNTDFAGIDWFGLNPFRISEGIGSGAISFPLLGNTAGAEINIINFFVSIAMLVLIPATAGLVRAAITQDRAFNFGAALGATTQFATPAAKGTTFGYVGTYEGALSAGAGKPTKSTIGNLLRNVGWIK